MYKKRILSVIASASTTAFIAGSNAMSAFAEGGSSASASNGAMTPTGSLMSMLIPTAILFAMLYFIAIRPQKKRDQEVKEMQANIQVGDEIVTGGGIVGIVVSIGEDTVVIETGGAKHKLRIKNWAITENVSAAERAKAAKPAKKSAFETAGVVDDSEKAAKKKKKKSEEE